MTTHNLKIWPEHFKAVVYGLKRAELRKNDRDYKVGDWLELWEWDQVAALYTGNVIDAHILHVVDVGAWLPGYVMLSIDTGRPLKVAAPECRGSMQAENTRLRGILRDFIKETHDIADERDCPFGVRALDWLRKQVKLLNEMERELAKRDSIQNSAPEIINEHTHKHP
ncbi:DUF3850 domain-containing protein [Salmonella enterica]|nr:DUF3850 domain-containing protein [Salmonella enterica]EEA2271419.1 DUF3850 domain-containing protein [Salmonella enterica]EFV5114824.1 DUF3850 domain-containing protein [Salmonella enterica]EGB7057524.1 DUF3850 domain-containing protein [Salmonella enterica]EKL9523980.1 DUF3850 domain-containing protein [Salmonella enterica]